MQSMQPENLKHEHALEAFAVSLWKSARACSNHEGWAYASDELAAVERYLNQLRIPDVRELAGDLKRLAETRAGTLPPSRDRRVGEKMAGSSDSVVFLRRAG